MALTRYKLGDLIEESFRKNTDKRYGVSYVRGISNNKQIMETKAEVDDGVIHKFYVVNPGEFVYNPRTTRMGDKVGLGYNNTNTPLLFSFNNIAFFIKDSAKNIILPDYLYMFFNRAEFDRYAMINGWGSATELFSMEEMCDIDIDLPPLLVQQKYVDIYVSLLKNQQNYEKSLDDIKTSCDAFFDKIKHENPIKISSLIMFDNKKNGNESLGIDSLRGINDRYEFARTTASVSESALDKYLIVDNGAFAVNFMCLGNWGKFYLAYNDSNKPLLVSPACSAFKIKKDSDLNPYYFLCLLQRSEFQRRCVFVGDGNTRGGINNDDFGTITIPLASMKKQKIIANLFMAYEERKNINEKLKVQIRDICPILIKGSLEEANK